MTKVFVEQPLALTGSANYIDIMNKALGINDNGDVADECDMAGCMEMDAPCILFKRWWKRVF